MAVAALSVFRHPSETDSHLLYCSSCNSNPITAPRGVTPKTKFLCRVCCVRIARERNAERRRLAAENSPYARRMRNVAARLLARGKNPDETDDATLADSTLD